MKKKIEEKEECLHLEPDNWRMIGYFHERGVMRMFCGDCCDEFNTSFEYYEPSYNGTHNKYKDVTF